MPNHSSTTQAPRLPKKKKQLAETIDQHADREQTLQLPKLTMYRLASLYLRGYRSFTTLDSTRGVVEANPYLLSESGKRVYQSQKLTKIISDNASKLASMDARPRVGRNGDSLSSIRQRSVAQVILDSITDDHGLQERVEEFTWVMATHGMAGITGDVQNHAQLGLTASPEVVHPRELMPWPSLGEDFTQARGVLRQRMVTIDQLEEVYGSRVKGDAAIKKMRWYVQDRGRWPEDPGANSTSSLYDQGWPTDSHIDERGADTVRYVLVRELWVDGSAGTLSEYAVTSGEYVFEHQDYTNQEVYRPLQMSRFMNDGTWHGLGLFGMLLSLHRELEDLHQRMFENIRDLDQHQTLIVPASQIPERPTMINIGDKYKAIGLQVDPSDPGFNPWSLPVNNSGDMPGRTAAQAAHMLGEMNPLDDLVEEKGRIDSGDGLQILREESSQKHTSALRSLNRALGGYHRSMLARTLRQLGRSPSKKMHLTKITPDLAGLVIDPEEDRISLERAQNPVPSISHLTFDVRSVSPRNLSQEKRAAAETLQVTGDWDGYVLHSIENDFTVDSYVEDYKAAYQMVSRNIVTLFNDGKTPGRVILTSGSTKPEIQLRVLHAFMAGPVYARASAEVQNSFDHYQRTLKGYLGNVLQGPPANPDDFAAVASESEARQR